MAFFKFQSLLNQDSLPSVSALLASSRRVNGFNRFLISDSLPRGIGLDLGRNAKARFQSLLNQRLTSELHLSSKTGADYKHVSIAS